MFKDSPTLHLLLQDMDHAVTPHMVVVLLLYEMLLLLIGHPVQLYRRRQTGRAALTETARLCVNLASA